MPSRPLTLWGVTARKTNIPNAAADFCGGVFLLPVVLFSTNSSVDFFIDSILDLRYNVSE